MKIKIILYTFTFLTLYIGLCNAQTNNNNVWIFGENTGLDFNKNPPEFVNSATRGMEGFASVCDDEGHLLFYSNGLLVWNGKHKRIKNDYILGNREQSCQQGVGIARVPNKKNQYYIFTLESKEFYSSERNIGYLRYHIVDMSADGGNGAVIEKNIILDSFMSEAMAIIPTPECQTYWLVTMNNSDTAKAYAARKIDGEGIHPPVYSPGHFFDALRFCVSNDGSKIVTSFYNVYLPLLTAFSRPLEIGDFDRNTGVVTNLQLLSTQNDRAVKSGTCFSPDDSKLYFVNTTVTAIHSEIGQFDMSKYPDVTAMTNSIRFISGTKRTDTGTLSLRVDNRGQIITINDPFFFSCIHNPNELGDACNYDNYYLLPSYWHDDPNNFVSGKPSSYFGQAAYVPPIFNMTINDTSVCLSDDSTIELSVATTALGNITWSTGETGPKITVNKNGTYSATVDIRQCQGSLTDSAKVIFRDECACTPFVPNAFSPNADGLNDELSVKVLCRAYNFSMNIYNRFGQRVFSSFDVDKSWNGYINGKTADVGTYFYVVNYSNVDGKHFTKKGDFILIR